jgi:hypothetical protein
MLFEIIATLVLIDACLALVISFTRVGDTTIEQNWFIKRYLPITRGWAVLYAIAALYIGYLTFFII